LQNHDKATLLIGHPEDRITPHSKERSEGKVRIHKNVQEYSLCRRGNSVSEFIKAARTSELAEGGLKKVTVGDSGLLLAKVNGHVYATELLCPHLKADLSEGTLSGAILTCPMHNSQFDIRDGRVLRWTDLTGVVLAYTKKNHPPRPLKCYPVRVEDDTILVGFP
jgi:3-phenylpropionate/trans-cinnamate dioxygenase ferredoxin subunit